MRSGIRWFGFFVLAMAAAGAYVYYSPKVVASNYSLPSATQYESLITTALSDATVNNAGAQGAPQQAVVNGWTARDLLTIIAKENADVLRAQGAVVDATGSLQTQPFDQRIPALLLLGVLAFCWLGISAPRGAPTASEDSARVTAAPAPVSGADQLADRLVQLEFARSNRLITDEEYGWKRAEIMSQH